MRSAPRPLRSAEAIPTPCRPWRLGARGIASGAPFPVSSGPSPGSVSSGPAWSGGRALLLLSLVLSSLAACGSFSGLTREERDALSQYQSRAQLFYDGGNYDSSLRMVQKGLDLTPNDYKLRNLSGAIHFQLRERDRAELRLAERELDAVHDERRPSNHEPFHLFFYAKTKQEIGRDHARQAELMRREAANADLTESERTILTGRAKEHASKSLVYWDRAANTFQQLIDREELLRFAHKGLMEIAAERNDYPNAVKHAELCLARNLGEQEAKQALIRDTTVVGYEVEKRKELRELVEQELRVREGLAEMHYRQGDFASAVEQLDKVLVLDPRNSTDYYNRARALEALGRVEAARRDYENFLSTTDLPNSDERVGRAYRFSRGE